MNNVFTTCLDINKRYDLKGSTHKRFTNTKQKLDKNIALKDLDYLHDAKNKIMINLSYDIITKLKIQIEKDTDLLNKCNCNDYSMLLGIHEYHSNVN